MAGRRQFGSVRHLPSGRWQARYRLPSGEMVSAPITFLTKGDAGRWLSSVETDRTRGLWLDPRAGRMRLEEYAKDWLKSRVRLAVRTREIYESQLRLHILPSLVDGVPALGRVALADLTPELIRLWYATLAVERSPSVAAKAYTRLRQILRQAVIDDRIGKNPCRIDQGGVERTPEQRFVSLNDLYGIADAVPARYRALILTAGLAGLRQGELFALRRSDLNLESATLSVRRKRLRLASGEVIEGDPKSEAGRRTVSLPKLLVAELRPHLLQFAEAGATGYVFVGLTGLPLERSNFRSRVWVPATEKAGVTGVRFHDLRHTAGTLAARTGATTKELMARLGHASPRASMIYQHAAAERDRLIAEGLDAMTVEAGLAPIVPIGEAAIGAGKKGRTGA
jgi:integrase